ncbi:MAG: T9SS type A sorting domain-containing protein [Candidatus Kapabacteria bacterium]|nr:T9SS type A sorting domain-containing protein [Ignavibacteriota bacterium]MCW5885721.1 T9SS type A sorting domain-containing protein [Candidatus Kapabacteria bacterium]
MNLDSLKANISFPKSSILIFIIFFYSTFTHSAFVQDYEISPVIYLEIPESFSPGSLQGYFTCKEIYDEFDKMIAKYPHHIFKDSIGHSIENNIIYSYKFSFSEISQTQVLYTSLHHGNEPGSAFSLIYYLWHLLDGYDNNNYKSKFILENKEIFVIPVINPDGVIFNDTTYPGGGGMWRKNRRINSDGSVGVDLNRNYGPDYAWDAPNNGSSSRGNLETYRGESPFSEPETRAVRDFMRSHNIKIAVNIHTYGDCVVHPFSYLTANSQDSAWYKSFLHDNYNNTGYIFGLDVDVIRFPYRGTSDDFMYIGDDRFNKVFAMTLEIGRAIDGFWAPFNKILADSEKLIPFYDNILFSADNNIALYDKDIINIEDDFYLSLKIQNIGLKEIVSANLKLESFSDSLIILNSSFSNINLELNEVKEFLFQILPNGIENGRAARFKLICDFGFPKAIEFEQIVYKYYEYELLSSDSIDYMVFDGEWNVIDTNDDKILLSNENVKYKSNQNSYARFGIGNLQSYNRYILRFHHKFDIEANFDLGLVYITDEFSGIKNIKDDFTVRGSGRSGGVQDENLWGFHGNFSSYHYPQTMVLSEFQEKISEIAFNLRTDNGLGKSGWRILNPKLKVFPDVQNFTSITELPYNAIRLYPNPADEYLIIENIDANTPFEIIDFLGNLYQINNEVFDNKIKLDLSKLSKGIYFIKISDQSIKFIKN